MNRKKYKIAALTLTLILLCSTAVYAWNMSAVSYLGNGVINIGAYSYSATDTVCDSVRAVSWLYKDNVVVDTDSESTTNATWAQADVSASNPIGIQNWRVEGYHRSQLGNYATEEESYDSGQR